MGNKIGLLENDYKLRRNTHKIMQFIVKAYDSKGMLDKRMEVRPRHVFKDAKQYERELRGKIREKNNRTKELELNKPTRFYQMDVVRYLLALSVIIAHFNIIFDSDIYWPISSGTAVGVFFGFSGFLVYASYLRHNNFKDYVISRAKRILPAYWFVVLSCAILLCGLSTLSVTEYFTDSSFWMYLAANMPFLNFFHPELPGVFTDHAVTAVNGSLWTLKVEWMLYLSIPVLIYLCRKCKIKMLSATISLFIISLAYKNLMEYIADMTGNELYTRLSYQFVGQFVYFYIGVLCYIYRQSILSNLFVFFCFGLVLLSVVNFSLNVMCSGVTGILLTDLLYPIAITIIFLSISLSKFITPKISVIGNCSYEMYLFHFPIMQCLSCSSALCALPKWQIFCINLILIYTVANIFHTITDSLWKKRNLARIQNLVNY